MSAPTAPDQPGNTAMLRAALPGLKTYGVLLVALTAIILFVFAEPLMHRAFDGQWQRGRFTFIHTLSLDLHAVAGLTFVGLFAAQVAMGYAAVRKRGFRPLHRGLGRVMFFGITPVFALVALWVTIDRSTNVAPADSVVFGTDRPMLRLMLAELLAFFVVYLVRSWRAIRARDVSLHVDSVFGAFVMASGIAIIRFLYAVVWAIRGGSPLSLAGMYFATTAVITLLLVASFAATRRLRQNAVLIGVFVAMTLATALLGWPFYAFLDQPR